MRVGSAGEVEIAGAGIVAGRAGTFNRARNLYVA